MFQVVTSKLGGLYDSLNFKLLVLVILPALTLLFAEGYADNAQALDKCLLAKNFKGPVTDVSANVVNLKVFFPVLIGAALIFGVLTHIFDFGKRVIKYGIVLFVGLIAAGAILGIANGAGGGGC